eukprot:TRINITY_DN3212_c0_g1_i6.p1 TRINITY_DN3212_c0_g1~~TRINITY_DN3212_c0_g1_i6.p1  ORF type:complete len:953 (+),score=185.89 TRINITY_DN3212_c0_g1_i6:67-2925(+)
MDSYRLQTNTITDSVSISLSSSGYSPEAEIQVYERKCKELQDRIYDQEKLSVIYDQDIQKFEKEIQKMDAEIEEIMVELDPTWQSTRVNGMSQSLANISLTEATATKSAIDQRRSSQMLTTDQPKRLVARRFIGQNSPLHKPPKPMLEESRVKATSGDGLEQTLLVINVRKIGSNPQDARYQLVVTTSFIKLKKMDDMSTVFTLDPGHSRVYTGGMGNSGVECVIESVNCKHTFFLLDQNEESQKAIIEQLRVKCLSARRALAKQMGIRGNATSRQGYMQLKLPGETIQRWTWCCVHQRDFYYLDGDKVMKLDFSACILDDPRNRFNILTLSATPYERIELQGDPEDILVWVSVVKKLLTESKELKMNSWRGYAVDAKKYLRTSIYLVIKNGQFLSYVDASAESRGDILNSINLKLVSALKIEGDVIRFKSDKNCEFKFDSEVDATNCFSVMEAMKGEHDVGIDDVINSGYVKISAKSLWSIPHVWIVLTKDSIVGYEGHQMQKHLFAEVLRFCRVLSGGSTADPLDFQLMSSKEVYKITAPDASSAQVWMDKLRKTIKSATVEGYGTTDSHDENNSVINYLYSHGLIVPRPSENHTDLRKMGLLASMSSSLLLQPPKTFIPRPPMKTSKNVVIDLGRSYTRCGVINSRGGEQDNPAIVPSIFATDVQGSGHRAFGWEARKKVLEENYTHQSLFSDCGSVNPKFLEEFLVRLFNEVMCTESEGKNVMIICDHDLDPGSVKVIAKILFDTLKVSKCRLVMSQFAMSHHYKDGNVLLVSFGQSMMITGYVHEYMQNVVRYPISGDALTEKLSSLLSAGNSQNAATSKFHYIAEEIKEKFFRITEKPFQNLPSSNSEWRDVETSAGVLSVREDLVASIPESLFDLARSELRVSIVGMISKYLQQLDMTIDISNVWLQGGSTRIPGEKPYLCFIRSKNTQSIDLLYAIHLEKRLMQ